MVSGQRQPPSEQILRAPAIELYLKLLKRSLTDTLFRIEPNIAVPESDFTLQLVRHYVEGPAVSMLPLARFDNIQACIVSVIKLGIPGDLIETGVWRGGATIFMRAVLKAYGVTDRVVWAADSFEGLPIPDADRFPLEARARKGATIQHGFRALAISLEEVRRNFQAYDLLDEQVRFLKGWFKDTLPAAPIQSLAVMRLDGDFYESTMDSLRNLYDRLSIGGYVIVDDYGQDSWTYCRNAVDEFRRERQIEDAMVPVDSTCVYWQRTK
jgi:O-methyltransferase